MQAEIFRGTSEAQYKTKYGSNMFKLAYQVGQKEGIRALYQGFAASFIGLLHPIIFFPLYEKAKQFWINYYGLTGED